MDFTLSLEQQRVQEKARRLAQEAKELSARAGSNEIIRLIIARDLLK